ncbi:MAG: peptidase M16, partial [Marinilabiliales bacterium]
MQVFTHQLSNGIRLVHHYSASKVAYVSAIINTGTRDEQEGEEGIAHFIEHVLFKGTQRRKAFHILSRLDDVGGEIDAYTTKENTAITEVFLNQHYDRGLELLSDIMFNSVFPEKELEKEKEVVIDEINSYKDAPSELIFDDFEEMVFADHSLGKSILGSKKSIKTFNRKKIEQFIKRNYNTDEIIICSIGDIPFKKLTKMTEKYFGHIPENLRSFKRLPFNNYSANSIIIKKRTYQAHCIL